MNFIKKKELLRTIEGRLLRQIQLMKDVLAEAKTSGIEEFNKLVEEADLKKMTAEELNWHVQRVEFRERIAVIQEEINLLKNEMFELEKVLDTDKNLTREKWETRLERKLQRPEK